MYDVETGLYYLRNRYYQSTLCRFISADKKINGNLYAYCRNMPIICLDSAGNDFIVITDTDGFTHTSALIQDSDGNWYYYYWGASKEGSFASYGAIGEGANMASNTASSSSAVPALRCNVSVIYESIDLDITDDILDLKSLNKTLNSNDKYDYEGGAYERYTYVKGDFSKSHEKALSNKKNASSLTYHLTNENCAQSVYEVFLEGYNNREKDKYYSRANRLINSILRSFLFIPALMHSYFGR